MENALLFGGIALVLWILSVIFIYVRYGAKPDQRKNVTELGVLYAIVAAVTWIII